MSLVNHWKLVHNEMMKIYKQKSTWIMYLILLLLIVGSGILTFAFSDVETEYSDDSWRIKLEEENNRLFEEMEEFEFFQEINMSLIAENNYYLEHDIKPVGYGAWHFVWENEILLSIVSLFTIIIAAGIIANEFRWGTIKLLLIRPISRTTILISKFTAVLLFALLTTIFVIVFSWFTGSVLFGVEGLNPYIVIEKRDGLEYVSLVGETMTTFALKLIHFLMMATFAFMISSIFRNSALAIGTAVFLMMAGNSIIAYFSDKEWAKYILFANTDLSQYTNPYGPVVEGMTLSFSVVILLVHFVLFMLAAWFAFTRRDISGT